MNALASEWERTSHYIFDALQRSPGLESLEDVERHLATGTYMLWTGEQSAAVTSIGTYGHKVTVTIVHAGGNKVELIESILPRIEAFASERGVDMLALEGREGWRREGEKRGWRFGYLTMFKDLKQ